MNWYVSVWVGLLFFNQVNCKVQWVSSTAAIFSSFKGAQAAKKIAANRNDLFAKYVLNN
jgi:hypothetical protein